MEFRKCKVLREEEWVEIKFKTLKKGDRFKLWEDDNTLVGEYTADRDAYYNSSMEIWTIAVNLTFPSPEKEEDV